MKEHLSQKNTWKYDIFCIFGKYGIFFPTNKQKKRRSSPQKYISGIFD